MAKFQIQARFVNQELEISLLNTLKSNPDWYWEVIDYLKPEVFTESNVGLFMDISNAIEADQPVNHINIPNLNEPLKNIGYIEVAKKLADLYQKRLLSQDMSIFFEKMNSNDSETNELIDGLESSLSGIRQSITEMKHGKLIQIDDFFEDTFKRFKELYESNKSTDKTIAGVSTHIPKLDDYISGLQEGIHMIAAEPGQGKTSFCLNMAARMSKAKVPVLFVSFEETVERLGIKAVCSMNKLIPKNFFSGQQDPKILADAYIEKMADYQHLSFIEGNSKTTVQQIKAKALRIIRKNKAKQCVIFIDYLQKWAGSSPSKFSEFRHTVTALVSELRELSLRLKSPIVIISSQNRSGQGSGKLESFKESGEIEYTADTAWFLVNDQERAFEAPVRAAKLILAKNRFGDKGEVPLIFRPHMGIFEQDMRKGLI